MNSYYRTSPYPDIALKGRFFRVLLYRPCRVSFLTSDPILNTNLRSFCFTSNPTTRTEPFYLVKGEVLQRPFLHCPARRLAGQKSCSLQHLSSAKRGPSSLKACALLPEPHHFVPEKIFNGKFIFLCKNAKK